MTPSTLPLCRVHPMTLCLFLYMARDRTSSIWACPECDPPALICITGEALVSDGVVAEGVQDSGDNSAHGLHVVSHTAKGEANGVPESTNNGTERLPKGG